MLKKEVSNLSFKNLWVLLNLLLDWILLLTIPGPARSSDFDRAGEARVAACWTRGTDADTGQQPNSHQLHGKDITPGPINV